MPYSQKYTLVSFLQPINIGTEFSMADWPLHVTLADVFAIDLDSTKIEAKLAELLSNQPPVSIYAKEDTALGTAKVVLLDKTEQLIGLHTSLVDLLEDNGAIFNIPDFTREGFLPHSTIQKIERLHTGDEVSVNTIALIDMFPHENWQQRKVINIFNLQSVRTE